jgi:hypothetical protein
MFVYDVKSMNWEIEQNRLGKFPSHQVQGIIDLHKTKPEFCGVKIKGVSLAGKIDNENLTNNLFQG